MASGWTSSRCAAAVLTLAEMKQQHKEYSKAAVKIPFASVSKESCLFALALLLRRSTRPNMLRGFPQRLWAVATKYELADPINVIEHHIHVSVTLTSATRMPPSPTIRSLLKKQMGARILT